MTTDTQTPMTLELKRVFAAPRPLVFKAWVDPVQLAIWWGPKGFTNPSAKPMPGPEEPSSSTCGQPTASSTR